MELRGGLGFRVESGLGFRVQGWQGPTVDGGNPLPPCIPCTPRITVFGEA